KSRVLAGEIITACMGHFDGIGLNRVDGLRTRHDFTSLEHLYLELALGHLRYGISHEDRAAIDGVQIVRKTRGQTPAQCRQFLRDCRRCQRSACRRGSTDCCTLCQKGPTAQILFHVSPPKIVLVLSGLTQCSFFPSLRRFLLLVLVLSETRLR